MTHISFSRVYTFSAAHRLHSAAFGEQENKLIYDKCNNLYGHGHDYHLEITVTGEPDKESGMIIPLQELDCKAEAVLKTLQYRHLDKEVAYFNSIPSTGENIIQYLWQELEREIGQTLLYHLKLWETNNNYFEMGKE